MPFVHGRSGYGKLVPQNWARNLAHEIVKAFCELGDKVYERLRLTSNYIVSVTPLMYNDNALLKKDYYDEASLYILHKIKSS